MSVAALARRLETNPSTIHRIMRNTQPPTLAQAWAIAEALEVDPADLLPIVTPARPASITSPAEFELLEAVRAGDRGRVATALEALGIHLASSAAIAPTALRQVGAAAQRLADAISDVVDSE